MNNKDKGMEEIFPNWNTEFGKTLRKLTKKVAEYYTETLDFGIKTSIIRVQVCDYLDALITPKTCYNDIHRVLTEYDLMQIASIKRYMKKLHSLI